MCRKKVREVVRSCRVFDCSVCITMSHTFTLTVLAPQATGGNEYASKHTNGQASRQPAKETERMKTSKEAKAQTRQQKELSRSQTLRKHCGTFFHFFFLQQLYCPNGISHMGNSGCFPRGKPTATESRYPTYCQCWVFKCFNNPPDSEMDNRIFNVRKDLNACNCTRGNTDTPTIYQLNYT